MGGFGSGRGRWRPKREDCRTIDVNRMHREGCLRPGYGGWWRWTVDDEEIASIRLVAESKREVEIVKRPREASGFVLLPRRWVVERSFAWFGRNRRLYKDCECHLRTALACLYIASVNMLLRRCETY